MNNLKKDLKEREREMRICLFIHKTIKVTDRVNKTSTMLADVDLILRIVIV